MKIPYLAIYLAPAALCLASGNAFCGSELAREAGDPQAVQAPSMLMAWWDPAEHEPVDGHQSEAGADAITPDLDFASQAPYPDATLRFSSYGSAASQATSAFYAYPLTGRATLGLGMGVAGLDSPSSSRNVVLTPSLAYSVNDRLLLSIGLDASYFDASRSNGFSQFADCVALEEAAALPLYACSDAIAYTPANLAHGRAGSIDADGSGYGYNVGATLTLGEDTRLGMRYRSGMALNVEDETVFHTAGPLLSTDLGRLTDQNAIAGLGLPESFAVGASHQLSERWSLAGDVTWVNWSQFDRLRIASEDTPQSGSVTSTKDWQNTYRYTLGLNYTQNEQWKYRLGAAYDQSPIPSSQRSTTLIPSEDLIWVAFGVGYSPTPRLSLDVGYAYPFFTDSRLYNRLQHNLAGQFEGEGDILSAQFKWRFE